MIRCMAYACGYALAGCIVVIAASFFGITMRGWLENTLLLNLLVGFVVGYLTRPHRQGDAS